MQKQTESFVQELKEKLTPLYTVPHATVVHDVRHVRRVASMGPKIKENCPQLVFDLDEFYVAAWLHNIDRVEPFESEVKHLMKTRLFGTRGSMSFNQALGQVTRQFFSKSHPFSKEAVDRIVDAVVQHSKKDDEAGDSHLLTALRIADKLERLNPLGLMTATVNAGTGQPHVDPKRPFGYGSTAEGRMKSGYDNFYRVLEWVAMLPFDEARAMIAKEDLLAFINFIRALGVQLARDLGIENTVEDDIRRALGKYYEEYAW